jgi:hypothetical protein
MKEWVWLMAASLFGVAGCNVSGSANSSCTPKSRQEAYKPVMPDLRPYFPASLAVEGERAGIECYPRLDPARAEMLSSLLAELDEPVISTKQSDALRFVWAGSFGGYAVVRIEPREGRRWLVARYRPDDPKRPENRVERPLTSEEGSRLDDLLARDPFGDTADAGRQGLDGSEWVLERMERGHYQLAERWSPEKARLREVGLYLAGLAGFGPPDMY